MTQAATAVVETAGQQNRGVAALNSSRVNAVLISLDKLLNSTEPFNMPDFSTQCLSLSRGIDYAVANNEPPNKDWPIPSLMKRVCELGSTLSIQSLTMVLLISVKNACKVGWFSEGEKQEIFALANKIGKNFCSLGDVNTSPSSRSIIKTIRERFYPRIKIGPILTAFSVKPGYGVYTNDFHIMKKMSCAPDDKIRLIVVQTDTLENSACIINPRNVNFIINGKGVEGRTNIYMDTGPQLPTNVTPLLKYGTNLLQVIGEFEGNCLVVVAFMCEKSLSDSPLLQDHVQSLVDISESDPDLIEGPSRISLNCPISRSRIKLPVKGHLCKHLQCFDYSNFVTINSRRPSWRCPHCNQYVCNTDIRVDQNMAKVLKEVGDNVVNVIISADGSWKAVLENDDNDHACDVNLTSLLETSELLELTDNPNDIPVVVDLTQSDDIVMDIDNTLEIEDAKPSVADLLAPVYSNDTIGGGDQNIAAPIDDEFFAGLNVPSGVGPTAWPDASGFSALSSSVASVLNPEPPPGFVNLHSSMTNFLLQNQLMSPVPTNEYGTTPSITRSAVSRVPIAVQALPAQTPGTQRTRPIVSSFTPSQTVVAQAGLSSHSPAMNGFNTIYTDAEREHALARSLINQPQTPPVVSSSSPQNGVVLPAQNRQDRFASQIPITYNSQLSEFQNPHLQQAFNPRISPHIGPVPLSLGPIQQMGSSGTPASSAQRAMQTGSRHHPMGSVQSQPPRLSAGQADPRSNDQEDLTLDQSWRPAGRMRGSLVGRDYSNFRDQIIQPTQQSQLMRPPTPLSPVTPNFQKFLASQQHNNAKQ